MTAEKPLCFCFDVSEADIRRHFVEEKGTYESLVEKTKFGTKCTACLLDFDMILESIHKGRTETIWGERQDEVHQGLRTTEDFADSGFFICDDDVSTYIRLANFGQLFREVSPNVPFSYGLLVFSESGELRGRQKGQLPMQTDTEINLSDVPGCPPRGWFLLTLRPHGDGLFGTMRPQIGLRGKNWGATYHTQPHMMATTEKYRFSVTILGGDEGLSAGVSVINAEKKNTIVDILLSDPNGDYEAKAQVKLPQLGSAIVELDDIFPSAPCDAPLFLTVLSDNPTRKHILNRHSDGSMSLDHFPN